VERGKEGPKRGVHSEGWPEAGISTLVKKIVSRGKRAGRNNSKRALGESNRASPQLLSRIRAGTPQERTKVSGSSENGRRWKKRISVGKDRCAEVARNNPRLEGGNIAGKAGTNARRKRESHGENGD